jgi:hypothetical protein
MSMHKIPLTPAEDEGLRLHGLDRGTPSQLSDVFRLGMKWQAQQAAPVAADHIPDPTKMVNRELLEAAKATLNALLGEGCPRHVRPSAQTLLDVISKIEAIAAAEGGA